MRVLQFAIEHIIWSTGKKCTNILWSFFSQAAQARCPVTTVPSMTGPRLIVSSWTLYKLSFKLQNWATFNWKLDSLLSFGGDNAKFHFQIPRSETSLVGIFYVYMTACVHTSTFIYGSNCLHINFFKEQNEIWDIISKY